ncbi:MAG: hypothetical protein U9N45_03290 [Gemmatimonadota bacterium]|nr:hypothetical protein [Gemmatimonadota bacterium]
MKLAVFNGSPRGEGSSIRVVISHFLEGFSRVRGNEYELIFLIQDRGFFRSIDAVKDADIALVAFSLYSESMPRVVQDFLEQIEKRLGRGKIPPLGFIVQAGSPGSMQCRSVCQYLEETAGRLGSEYKGTVIKRRISLTGVHARPSWATRRLLAPCIELGACFAQTGEFDQALAEKLAEPHQYPGFKNFLLRTCLKLKSRSYWKSLLHKGRAHG